MVEAGVFADDRLELLYGALVERSPQKAPHAWVVEWLTSTLVLRLSQRAQVRVQLPLALTDDSVPEPDIAVVPAGDHRRAHPSQAHLIIEVADSSAAKDTRLKARLYAEAAVPDYWVVDLAKGEVLVHRDPTRPVTPKLSVTATARWHCSPFRTSSWPW